jgi:hypothetical protein
MLFALGVCGCGGGDGGGGGGVQPVNLVNFQAAGDIVGQTTVTGVAINNGAVGPNQVGLNNPLGHVGNGSLYVADTDNHRVLGWTSLPTGLGQPADFVLGQGLFTTNVAANPPTAASLNAPWSCWVASGALFVADRLNHRVLIYSPAPTSSGASASLALGQANLTSKVPGIGAGGLNEPRSVCVAVNRIVVADTANNRVLIWNGIPVLSGATAQIVVGQPDFTTVSPGPGAAKMNMPMSVWTDGTRLIVGDSANNRVLVWTTFPVSNGQAADLVVGQPDFATVTPGVGSQTLDDPRGVGSDGVQLFVADADNSRVLIFSPFPTSSNPAATGVLGQNSFTNNTPNDDDQNGISDATASARTMWDPYGVTIVGNKLFVTDLSNSRVLIFAGS